MTQPEDTTTAGPLALSLHAGLGPLPEADGTAEANKERHPEGGYTYNEIPAWSEALVRAYALAEVQRAVAAMMSRCQGKKHDGCNYLAHCGMVCNKCGQVA